MPEEIAYRFPYGRAAVEMVSDFKNTFRLRLAWQRGKAVIDLFESTPLRPLGEISCGGQTFSLNLNKHKRERRERIRISGDRPVGESGKVQCQLSIEGRNDRLSWEWRLAAKGKDAPAGGDVTFQLPFCAGKVEVLTLSSTLSGLAVWRDGVVISLVVPGEFRNRARLEFTADARAVRLFVPDAAFSGAEQQPTRLETWLAPAATRREAEDALLRHLADAADRAQQNPTGDFLSLLSLGDAASAALMAPEAADKRGLDRLLLRARPDFPGLNLGGEGADAAQAAFALLQRYRFTGDDAEKRRALLLARGMCEFQIVQEESPQRGAFWDALRANTQWMDASGGRTQSITTAARAAYGLLWLHAQFSQDILTRTALGAAQWLMLKMDEDGRYAGERYQENGTPVSGGSPWVMAEALRPLVETFRRTGNEVFLNAALRGVRGLREGLADGSLTLADAPAQYLASAVEGLLFVSREAENADMIALATLLGHALRARRAPDGAITEDDKPSLPATLAAARAALALTRVDTDPAWALVALRALRAASRMVDAGVAPRPADLGAFSMLPTHLLLSLSTLAPQCAADRDALTVMRSWQVFQPETSTREFIRVRAKNSDAPVDHLALVCPSNLQVLIIVLAGPDTTEIEVVKTGRTPFLKNLLTGDYGQEPCLVPLGDGADARFAVFLADT